MDESASPGMLAARRVHRLDEASINRIAAGEVIERPASVVKELVENSIDAGADKIEIHYSQGAKSLIRVSDNGRGIEAEDLPLAVARHATSKIDGSDLLNIRSFGFRGEALALMGAAGRLSVKSRPTGADFASIITVKESNSSPVQPAALTSGTVIELTELFKSMPSRLKFLRTERSESAAMASVVRSLAMALPTVGFELTEIQEGGDHRRVLDFRAANDQSVEARLARVSEVIGSEFADNAVKLDWFQDGVSIKGFAAIPTFSRGSASAQHLFVNGRPVRDKLLFGALRAAYLDLLPSARYPVAALFIECDPHCVDVNVHPAKTEVRFREPNQIRTMIIKALRTALSDGGPRSSTSLTDAMVDAWHVNGNQGNTDWRKGGRSRSRVVSSTADQKSSLSGKSPRPDAIGDLPPWADSVIEPEGEKVKKYPLGAARLQLHDMFILAENSEGIVFVDQHAAHERIVYERLKDRYRQEKPESQMLLVPATVELNESEFTRLIAFEKPLSQMGLEIERFGPTTMCVRSIPAILGSEIDCDALLRDIADSLKDTGEALALERRANSVISRMACHGSIRAGR